MDDRTWELECILRDAREHPEIDEEFYAKQIEIQMNPNTIGFILRTGDFADWVERGSLTSYDGWGYFCDNSGNDVDYEYIDGETHHHVPMDPEFVRTVADKYPYVRWCNK